MNFLEIYLIVVERIREVDQSGSGILKMLNNKNKTCVKLSKRHNKTAKY